MTRLSTQLKQDLEAIEILLQRANEILETPEQDEENEPLWKLNID